MTKDEAQALAERLTMLMAEAGYPHVQGAVREIPDAEEEYEPVLRWGTNNPPIETRWRAFVLAGATTACCRCFTRSQGDDCPATTPLTPDCEAA